jgi:hypothetical protein
MRRCGWLCAMSMRREWMEFWCRRGFYRILRREQRIHYRKVWSATHPGRLLCVSGADEVSRTALDVPVASLWPGLV